MTSTERSRARRARMTSAERTAYHARYAAKRRVDLLKLLAPDGRCAGCGDVHEHAELTVDHVDGITWDHNEVGASRRVARYWREHRAGVRLRALCGSCNSSDGSRRRWA